MPDVVEQESGPPRAPSTIVTRIGQDTRTLIVRRYPEDAETPTECVPTIGPVHRVPTDAGGVVQSVDDDRLAEVAVEHRCSIRPVPAIGDFLPTGATLFEVTGQEPPDGEGLCAAVVLNAERTLDQDVGFGLRHFVDIALRALSSSLNDPTTAVQVVDQLHDLLRCLATRPMPPRRRYADGVLVLTVPEARFGDLLALAVDEIARVGAEDPRIRSRLHRMLLDLGDVARPEHFPPIIQMLSAFADS